MSTDRRERRRRLFEAAAQQGGYFTAAQAKSLGYSYQAQAHHVEAGNWWRVDRGLFRLVEWVPGTHDELARWTLWSRSRAVVSHESAATVHGIGEFESGRIHLTVPPGFTMHDDAVALHYAHLPADDVSERSGYRVTTPLRTLVDIATNASDEDQLARAIDDARRTGLITTRRLRSRAESLDPRAALYIERAIQQAETS
ncbi:type IV toxin-antitoxin system AbiEi family antitoxin domain-containing protein [Nocardia alni]|uniref:type IV toxin-antitoxin system AbiEi family antitoxin domain-containing protein n=1 Tax=Nocardia alni TaxID=2815723 RepID=UPI001C228C6B|nr:type IV toxin-antitoxin system AbiEi family antitoxin domain-containing protein [Nocardia alni]